MIPPTIIVSKDKALGYELKKFALQQLSILERLMSFQKINDDSRVVSPYPGVLVECWSCSVSYTHLTLPTNREV